MISIHKRSFWLVSSEYTFSFSPKAKSARERERESLALFSPAAAVSLELELPVSVAVCVVQFVYVVRKMIILIRLRKHGSIEEKSLRTNEKVMFFLIAKTIMFVRGFFFPTFIF